MNNDYEHTYECEDCGGIFVIQPETDEEVVYCPQCGCNDTSTFVKVNSPE